MGNKSRWRTTRASPATAAGRSVGPGMPLAGCSGGGSEAEAAGAKGLRAEAEAEGGMFSRGAGGGELPDIERAKGYGYRPPPVVQLGNPCKAK
jgi:hypothetical protein